MTDGDRGHSNRLVNICLGQSTDYGSTRLDRFKLKLLTVVYGLEGHKKKAPFCRTKKSLRSMLCQKTLRKTRCVHRITGNRQVCREKAKYSENNSIEWSKEYLMDQLVLREHGESTMGPGSICQSLIDIARCNASQSLKTWSCMARQTKAPDSFLA
jgi:hypothetical protein